MEFYLQMLWHSVTHSTSCCIDAEIDKTPLFKMSVTNLQAVYFSASLMHSLCIPCPALPSKVLPVGITVALGKRGPVAKLAGTQSIQLRKQLEQNEKIVIFYFYDQRYHHAMIVAIAPNHS